MEQNCFQRRFAVKSLPKSDFKVILKVISKWFQSDFSCKIGAKLLPEEIFREKSIKKWFQYYFETGFKMILIAKMEQNCLQSKISWKIRFLKKMISKLFYQWFQSDSKWVWKWFQRAKLLPGPFPNDPRRSF